MKNNNNWSMTNSSSSSSLMTRLMQITHGSHHQNHIHHQPPHPSPVLQSLPSTVPHEVQSSTGQSLMTSREEDAAAIESSSNFSDQSLPSGPSPTLLQASKLEPEQGSKSPMKVASSSCLSLHGSTDQQMVSKSASASDHRRSPVVITFGSNASTDSAPRSSGSTKDNANSEVDRTKGLKKKQDGASTVSSRGSRKKSEWEILEGLKEGQTYDKVPDKFEGWMLKRRKWPLKGWHKRWFVIENGVLSYTKNPGDIHRGKIHGSVDVGLSVISTKLSSKRIDIDAEEFIYHIKCKNKSSFANWVVQLRAHRLYRQHQIAFGSKVNPNGSNTTGSPTSVVGYCNLGSPSNDHKVASWILDSSHVSFDSMYKELNEYQVKLVELSSILQVIESQAGSCAELLDEKENRSAKKGGRRRFLPLGRHKKQQSVTVPPSSTVTNYCTPASQQQSKGTKAKHSGQHVDSFTELGSSSGVNNNLSVVSHGNVMPHVRSESALSMHQDSSDQESVPSSCASFTVGQTGGHFTFSGDPQPQSHHIVGASSNSSLAGNQRINNTAALSGTRYQLSVDQGNLGQSILHVKNSRKGGSSAKPLDDFISTATEIHEGLRSCLRRMQMEREHMKRSGTFEADNLMANKVIASLQQTLQSVFAENKELKHRLGRIHEESVPPDCSDEILGRVGSGRSDRRSQLLKMDRVSSVEDGTVIRKLSDDNNNTRDTRRKSRDTNDGSDDGEEDDEENSQDTTIIHQPIGRTGKAHKSTSVLSISEYFDAEERLSTHSTTSSEEEEEEDDNESFATDLSEDDGLDTANAQELMVAAGSTAISTGTGRRSTLPAPSPDLGDTSLWSILYKNIGKDLSKISMPVTLNEPLSVLQRLCEELEYSDLLDKASMIDDPCERMVQMAAFAVSAYGSATHRAGHKPFNPLLGETYECVREDKGFKFIAEQVCHHPPVSACHAESENFIFWQDMRIKTKFWGKSMEIIPFGDVHVLLRKTNSHYKWNKVTTCVHNIIKGQRWVDQYGEMIITELGSGIKCSLTFIKASYWSNKKHEITGVITSSDGQVLETIFGKWDESLYAGTAPSARCIWRPGAMNPESSLYYGFSRFAIELNELTDDLATVLPPTDTRFRPDQRLLEEGRIQAAESAKIRLEQIQRERRRLMDVSGQKHVARWFQKEVRDGEDYWIFNGQYWQCREDGSFRQMQFDDLWPDS